MTVFAFVDYSSTVRQLDTATPSTLPYPVYDTGVNTWSLALTGDKEWVFVGGTGYTRDIWRTKGSTNTLVYTHPTNIHTVRTRNVGGVERVYFSAYKDIHIWEIYYFVGTTPKLYTTIHAEMLPYPNPCDPNGADWFSYDGDFVFDDGNNLYLSSGNILGPKIGLKCGIYRMTDAGPDTVTGAVERIYLGDGPIEDLCYQNPDTLYFLRQKEIWRLDLLTMTDTLEGQIKTSDPNSVIQDLAYINAGYTANWWWTAVSNIVQILLAAATSIWNAGERRTITRSTGSRPPSTP